MMVDTHETAARIKRICLNLLLDGATCVLDCLDNRFVHKLTGWRGVSCQAFGGRMPMCLPDARSCTSWVVRTRHESATSNYLDAEQFQFSSPEATHHAFSKTGIILETAVERARVCGFRVGWQGATTQRAGARKEEQPVRDKAADCQTARKPCNRARSGVT
jgi:hypothetical protein